VRDHTDPGLGFFAVDGDSLVPRAFATSPWGGILHGRLVGGLAARETDQALARDEELVCARLTVDMFRSVPLAPLSVSGRVIRDGRRITVLETTVAQCGEPIGRGTAVLLRRSEQPPSVPAQLPAWDAPCPDSSMPPVLAPDDWAPPWDLWPAWPARPGQREAGMRAGIWMRDTHPLVDGEPLSPLVRVSIAADMVSPVANFGADGLGFINADYTIYLARAMRGEIVGIQPRGHLSHDGVSAAQGIAHDADGPFALLGATALANSFARAQANAQAKRDQP